MDQVLKEHESTIKSLIEAHEETLKKEKKNFETILNQQFKILKSAGAPREVQDLKDIDFVSIFHEFASIPGIYCISTHFFDGLKKYPLHNE